ncbi:hypothetical protein [Legionella taurinensis]|uniref:hypothetical protein n=1 Tax=Legionella taurinensis TaxID=70611 RepID=UPI00135CB45F|nr:hypothetical protein [Legionella taurinensis]
MSPQTGSSYASLLVLRRVQAGIHERGTGLHNSHLMKAAHAYSGLLKQGIKD